MNYYISVSTDAKSNDAARISLQEALHFILKPENASEEKGGWLFHPAYNDTTPTYKRWENQMTKCSTIMIDCDNKNKDPDILNKWHEAMKDYDYIIYETYSSTKELPKFRAIVPLDEEMVWSKHMKMAIVHTFSQFSDEKATWYFAPTRNKLNTFKVNKGTRKFPSSSLVPAIQSLAMMEQIEMTQRLLDHSKYLQRKEMGLVKEYARKDYHELPLVQEYFSAVQGERNSSAHKAACSMFARGYENHEVKAMLSEGPLERKELNQVFNSASRCRK